MVIEKNQEIQGYRTEDMNMEKYKFDDRNGLWYELQGDYYLPCLKLRKKNRHISGYGDSGIAAISRSIAVYSMPTC